MNALIVNILNTKRGQKVKDCYGPIVIPVLEKLQFLVDEFGFNMPSLDMARHEFWIVFEKDNAQLNIEYEQFNFLFGQLRVKNDDDWLVYSINDIAPMTDSQKQRKLPIQIEQVEERLDQIVCGLRNKLTEVLVS